MTKIVLIGTSHKYQIGCAKVESIEQFEHLLRSLCSEHGVTVIAEEMNQVALTEAGVTESVAGIIATELKLTHQLLDPLPEVREQLGIRAENDIQAQGFINNWAQAQIEFEMRKSLDIREQYWLDQLNILNSWPLLFVCGANHSESFPTLLRSSGFEVVVSVADWEPNNAFDPTSETLRAPSTG